ncbi:broad specificity phosphatase PhoE [Enterococcus sp. PF1-24]|uniref:histidine phosphatase family protein n=1 Tax=unclassified Enterococcus TaxID=2608891 RepID=UPI002473277D|nr:MULTISPECIES: histidine phosphatase family protein [unclassified Enterococcus]MDH6365775.1 broad specificity phosphatase PhoE [Enterococcus sp. PFB1-1]MDH6402875.1 broad specificity phosphatase PhoE [Enterococcus sp. PF1-24]
MQLYFTRHGKTEWNDQMRFQGKNGNSPLLPESYQEIKKLGKYLQAVPFEKIYASTSQRARETAQGIANELKRPVEIIYSDDLREFGLGDLEGQLIAECRTAYSENLDNMRYHLDKYDPTPFNGEEIQAVLERMSRIVLAAVAQHQGPLLFVGHGASMTAAVQWLAGKSLAELRSHGGLTNSSLSILETTADDKLPYHLVKWNDNHFLK